MPRLYWFRGFAIYFWSHEPGEPVHVHVSKGRPTEGATKIWLTKAGGSILSSNGSQLNRKELSDVLAFVAVNHADICGAWQERFGGPVQFYK